MSQKAMKVVVELNLRAVTCPGVHLQAKDDVYLSVCLMNQYRQSECLPAVFPLLLREKMRFEKVFWHASDPGALAEVLENEIAKVELIQLTPPVGESLASFVEDARSFLYPEPKLVPPVGGVDRAVLMSRGPAFLGICPRLEFSTRTVISEWSASEETAYNPVPLRVLTQKRGRKRARPGRFSPERLSSSAPWRSGRRRSRDGAPAGTTRVLDEELSQSDAEDLLDDDTEEDLSQSGTGKDESPTPAVLWRAYRERPHLNGSLLCSENVWEDVQTRLRSLLTSPKAMHRLANGATDSEVDEVLYRRSISPHSGGRADQHRPNTEV
ncbi:spermatogenesis associated 6-like protein [Alosa pseudoharengus]|uniref:spermatogenesis associated 6-like protein n=1 Tax=Alosa pseudoharengus TaxID=34774 RepID=UPI003F8A2B96